MARFKIGDRVRIDCPLSDFHGKAATVIGRLEMFFWADWIVKKYGYEQNKPAFLVCVDGVGTTNTSGVKIGFPAHELKPLVPPADEAWWQAFKRNHFQPDPAIIMAREPEVMAWWPSP